MMINAGRSPHGERGLKFPATEANKNAILSLPARGAWIEIQPRPWRGSALESLPARGAWIEICG